MVTSPDSLTLKVFAVADTVAVMESIGDCSIIYLFVVSLHTYLLYI